MDNTQFAQGGTGNTTTEETNNSTYFEKREIEGTPFTAIMENRDENELWYLTIGKYKISDPYASFEHAAEQTTLINWNLLADVVGILVHGHLNKGE